MEHNPYAAPTVAVEPAFSPTGSPGEYIPWKPTEIIGLAYERFKDDWAVVLGTLILSYVMNFALSQVAQGIITGHWGFGVNPMQVGYARWAASLVTGMLLGQMTLAGLFAVTLASARHEGPTLGTFFNGMAKVVPLALSYIVFFVAMMVGLVFLIVPGIIIALGFSQMFYLAVDRGMNPMEAARASWAMTRGTKADIFVVFILCGLLGLAGLLACGIGLLVALPVTVLSGGVLYVRLLPRLGGTEVTATAAP